MDKFDKQGKQIEQQKDVLFPYEPRTKPEVPEDEYYERFIQDLLDNNYMQRKRDE